MTQPKIDILLTYWGDFELFKKTVESVLAQTSDNWILRIFDDCYPTHEAENYFKTLSDKRIIYFRHKKNIGITKNFNFALESAKEKYCILLGCDDKLLPNYVETTLNNIGSADFYQPAVEVINEIDQVYLPLGDRIKSFLRPKKPGIYQGEKLASSLSKGNWLYFPSITWKTDVIKKYGFDKRFSIAQDVVLELNIIKDGGKLFVDNQLSFQYRRFAGSLSSLEKSKGGVRFNEENNVYNYFAREFKRQNWPKAARSAKLRITSRIHQGLSKL